MVTKKVVEPLLESQLEDRKMALNQQKAQELQEVIKIVGYRIEQEFFAVSQLHNSVQAQIRKHVTRFEILTANGLAGVLKILETKLAEQLA